MATPQMPMMSTIKHSIDLKANGEVSRMRNHKGNMPSLPQTKYCSLCPAKFTRTTHLNRHLRSHTNERSHRCNTCQAEFTRSDLLTRHKRTCGDSRNANRSRRKSCQACAESKVKCNLQYPCSKCASRGRECVFINDPETSRNKKLASKKATSRSIGKSPTPVGQQSELECQSPDLSPSSPTFPSLYSSSTNALPSPTLSLNSSLSTLSNSAFGPSFGPPSLSHSSGSSPSSSRASPRSDLFDVRSDVHNAFDLGFDNINMETHLDRLFPNNIFEPFLDDSLSPCNPAGPHQGDFGSWIEGSDFGYGAGDDAFGLSQPLKLDHQAIFTDFSNVNNLTTHGSSDTSGQFATHSMGSLPLFDTSVLAANQEPAPEELDHYLYLFFSAFCTQVPLLHQATWSMDGKPVILVRAMQACGALFVKTRTAMTFITNTLLATRDALILEFAKTTSDLREQMHLILAVVLLQTIGLFHQRADQRVSSNVYHGMLVMMIRRTGLIGRIGSWLPKDLTDPSSIESAWKDWAHYETIKRALFLSYLHDCCHCMYFSLPPSFNPNEFDICLPCDDALWGAVNARDWYHALQSSSPYGSGPSRITGVRMQRALAVLAETRPSPVTLLLNPFAHFILIHTILRNIYASRTPSSSFDTRLSAHRTLEDFSMDGVSKDNAFAAQYALHNWLQLWMNCPEAMRYEKTGDEPPFVCNAMPFYWLAQVAIVAIQDEMQGIPRQSDGKTESRYRLLREWLDRIRTFLRGGSQIPTHLWDELMKIRLQISHSVSSGIDENPDGLLAFFPSS